MFDRLRALVLGKPDNAKSLQTWVGGALSTGDVASSRGYGRSDSAKELIARATQWVRICATRNAQVAASQTIRLYTRGRKGRPLGRRTRAAMEAGRLGVKAADYASRGGDVVEVEDHPALELVRKPNGFQSGNELEHLVFVFKQLTGNAYLYLTETEDGLGLFNMDPARVRVELNATDLVSGYWYGSPGSDTFLPRDEVIHAKYAPGIRHPVFGEGPLHAVLREADLYANATDSELYRWANMSRPDFLLKLPPGMTPQQGEQAKKDLENLTRGVRNRGRMTAATIGEIVPLGWSPHEMEYVQGQDHAARSIWAAFGIPESVLRLNDANLASAQVGNTQWLSQTIQPMCNTWAEELTAHLLPKLGYEPGVFWFGYDDVSPEDRKAIVAEAVQLVSAGLATPNEARATIGMDPLPGLDTVRTQTLPQGPNPQAPGDGASAGSAAKSAARPGHEHKGGCCGSARGRKDRNNQNPHESAAVIREIARLTVALEGWFRAATAEGRILPDGTWNLTPDLEAELRTIIERGLPKVYENGGLSLARDLKLPVEELYPDIPKLAAEYARTRAPQLVADVVTTTRTSIGEAVARGIEEGQSIQQIQRDLIEGGYDSLRAERIARTESASALGAARVDGIRAAGFEKKEWLVAGGPCPLCEALVAKGGTVGIDEPFIRAGESLTTSDGTVWTADRAYFHEPLHPNCRCVVVPAGEGA